ncbi:MAG: helix-turn-helix transcriptional regulator [Labilithrix sp.]|nr:helix-turn-helix transcriptional regulator [Labilithrix sp.]MCW5811603.1 helix-turn-helix transcriptional regulator [Labilithrix sp.]
MRELRGERGFTQEELCERAGISVDAISRIEGGSRTPTLDTIESVAEALGVSPLAFFDPDMKTAPSKKSSASLRRIVALLDGQDEELLRVAETCVTAVVRAYRLARRGTTA